MELHDLQQGTLVDQRSEIPGSSRPGSGGSSVRLSLHNLIHHCREGRSVALGRRVGNVSIQIYMLIQAHYEML